MFVNCFPDANLALYPSVFVAGDLFDMLLPMLGIYQEYVRNHHYSLQVRTLPRIRHTYMMTS